MRVIEMPPKPSPLIESIRAIGYSLSTALADIVDNCITARAEKIRIFSSTEPAEARVGILDDGVGLTEEELLEAMRLGSRNPVEEREESDLGRFGLGLKTASFSQCRVLTVVSRTNGTSASARWNLDHIAESGRWQIQIPDDLTSIPWSEHLGSSGTLVVWEHIGLGADDGDSGRNIADFIRQMDEARSHLELVFHRFLSGEPGRRSVSIEMNNRPLEPFDPFHSRHPATIAGPEELIRVSDEDVLVQAFTLPHHGKVTPAEWERYAGPEGYLRNQGLLRLQGAAPDHPWHLVWIGASSRAHEAGSRPHRYAELPRWSLENRCEEGICAVATAGTRSPASHHRAARSGIEKGVQEKRTKTH